MDSWNKYKSKKFANIDLTKVNISKTICYANFLIADLAWKAANTKLKQKHIDKFFEQASLILQATIAQKGFENTEKQEVYNYIDTTTKTVSESLASLEEFGTMMGNFTEISEAHYTFTELIAFVRVLAAKI